MKLLTTSEIIKKYGRPGDESKFVKIELPYPMVIAWDKKYSITKMTCHYLVAENFKKVFSDILKYYGLPEIKRLGIDLYGGCYNFRQMRGGSDWSRHSWAIAIDLSPEKNPLKTKWKDSQFAKPEYKKMIDAFYRNGFVSLGLERGFDAMHFEIAS